MKRTMVWIASLALLLLVSLLGALGAILGTETGTNLLLRQLQTLAPEIIQFSHSRGRLLDHLVIDNLGIDWGSGKVEAGRVLLDWSPAALLGMTFDVNELSAIDLRYTGTPAQDVTPEPMVWPIELPQLSLPIKIVAQQVFVDKATINLAPESAPIVIDSASLEGIWDNSGITLESLQASAFGHAITINGKIDPTDTYALDLHNQLQLRFADGNHFKLDGTIQGDTAKLNWQQHLSGAADMQLSGNLEQVLHDPSWNARLAVDRLPGTVFSQQLPLELSGKIETAGNWSSAVLKADLRSASEVAEFDQLEALVDLAASPEQETVALNKLHIKQLQGPLQLKVTGDLSTDNGFDLAGQWRSLQWPLDTGAIAKSEHGELALKGEPSHYQLNASTDIVGDSIPAGNWQLQSSGNQQGLEIASLNARLLEGYLDIAGVLAWKPFFSWQLDGHAQQINPRELLPGSSGSIDIALNSQGSIGDDGLQAQIDLQDLAGELNTQALSGSGKLAYARDHSHIDKLAIKIGAASVLADGAIGPNSNLQWALVAPALEKLHPQASGSVSSQGSLTGPLRQPQVSGNLNATAARYKNHSIGALKADIKLDLQDKNRSTIAIEGADISIANNDIAALTIAMDGFIRDHSLTLAASPEQGSFELDARGGYADASWNGTLDTLDLEADELGLWRLQQAVTLELGTASASSNTLCLARESSRLCAQGQWQAQGQSNAEFQITALPLDWIKAWLPLELKQLGGELSASGELAHNATLSAQLQAQITPGEFVIAGIDKDVRVAHSGAELDFNTQAQGASGSLVAGIDSARLKANIQLPDLMQVSATELASLNGMLQLQMPDLSLVPLLAPMVTHADGSIDANFEFGGRLGDPQLSGSGQLLAPQLEMAQFGVRLSDTLVDIHVVNDVLVLKGSTVSGSRLDIDGSLELDAEQDWPLAVSVVGDDFIATNLPNLQIHISPDLKLERQSGKMILSGTLTVPEAEIVIRDLPSGARTASPDVVVLHRDGSDAKSSETTPIATDIVVALGNKVHLSALGFRGFVGGELNLRANAQQALLATGDVRIDEGTYRTFGQRMEIERGLFSYANSPIDNPGVNLKATRDIGEVTVGVNALGTARRISVSTFSSPPMSENDRISYLLTGKPASGTGANVSLERQVARNLSVGVNVDTHTGESAFVTRYRILRTLHTEVGSSARSSTLDLFYTIETQ